MKYSIRDGNFYPLKGLRLLSAKSGFGYTSFDDKIYVAGGNDGKSILSDFDEYNTFKNSATS
jgi:hypothetical protein